MNDVGRTGMQTEFPTDVQYALLALLADLLGELRSRACDQPARACRHMNDAIEILQDVAHHVRLMQADIENLCAQIASLLEKSSEGT